MFLQSVLGLSASAAGLGLMVFMIAVNLSAAAAGQTVGRQRRYKILPMIGLGLAVVAVPPCAGAEPALRPLVDFVVAWHADEVARARD